LKGGIVVVALVGQQDAILVSLEGRTKGQEAKTKKDKRMLLRGGTLEKGSFIPDTTRDTAVGSK